MSRPVCTIIAGPNGSGKSTVSRSFEFEGKERLLDPDAVAKRMSPDDVTRSALAAGREVLTLTRKYLTEGLSFAVETTLAGNGPVETMRRARERGFHVSLIYVCLDSPERNVRRVKERVIQGGHAVPGEDIRRRYERSLENLPEAIKLADTAVLLDNTDKTRKAVLEATEGKIVWVTHNPPAWVKPIVAALS